MELYQYFWENKIKMIDFAKSIGKNSAYMSRVIRYRVVPSLDLAYRIQQATNGQVNAKELVKRAMERKIEMFMEEKEQEQA